MPVKECTAFLLEGTNVVVLVLAGDIVADAIDPRSAHQKGPVSILPVERGVGGMD